MDRADPAQADQTAGGMPSGRGTARTELRTFLIADIRGYTKFTSERGDEAAAELRLTDLPRRVGIGLDAGEAVPVEDGYRGGALNVAARLGEPVGCALIQPAIGAVDLAALCPE